MYATKIRLRVDERMVKEGEMNGREKKEKRKKRWKKRGVVVNRTGR